MNRKTMTAPLFAALVLAFAPAITIRAAPPSATATEAHAPAPADAAAIAVADRVLDRFDAGDYAGVRADFNVTMAAALDEARLAAVGQQLAAAGAIIRRGAPETSRHQGQTVVAYRIERAQATLLATVAIDGDGKVGGLHFVPAPPLQ